MIMSVSILVTFATFPEGGVGINASIGRNHQVNPWEGQWHHIFGEGPYVIGVCRLLYRAVGIWNRLAWFASEG